MIWMRVGFGPRLVYNRHETTNPLYESPRRKNRWNGQKKMKSVKNQKKCLICLSVLLVDCYRFLSVVSVSFQSVVSCLAFLVCRFKSIVSSLSFLHGLTSLVSLLAKVWLQFKSDSKWNKLGKCLTILCSFVYRMLYDVLPRYILLGNDTINLVSFWNGS